MKWHTEGLSVKPRAISHEAAYVQLFLKPPAKRSALRERGRGRREEGQGERKGGKEGEREGGREFWVVWSLFHFIDRWMGG